MRFYSLTNFYISTLQIGIQTSHCIVEMMNNCIAATDVNRALGQSNQRSIVFHDWAQNHKTIICINGGNNLQLHAAMDLFCDKRNTDFPIAAFSEDEQSMNNMLTCVGIVLPEYIYNPDLTTVTADILNTVGSCRLTGRLLTTWETKAAMLVKSCSLAR